jgi:hypothetical protein
MNSSIDFTECSPDFFTADTGYGKVRCDSVFNTLFTFLTLLFRGEIPEQKSQASRLILNATDDATAAS